MKAKIFGIPNCNSVKKARIWLKEHNIEEDFHDFKKKGVDKKELEKWVSEFGWESVLNRKGTTWRNLDQAIKDKVTDEKSAINLMLENTSAIKRPIIESKKGNTIGFDEENLKTTHL
ncbi:arsenate reductase related protein [Pseudopedobacter saltans DSM 12145]|uniref:Arsenate reductase related protein n=1 Tax=Pseudopedobacter saltans (strain ATCC 51119 / DSM 12145 / JCM 21818 / CCUG 39354 / LMG 10337 / NBRC 100064 / NCIMB 13643) TaxID=762903 RepID=F0SDK9_PSESL|nr:Spx/MgsR family RNA polymerase-binding regulatory protein [Pseudopedobacter saltans]ADY50736.1 arsenate reductase related protein [Pseudopedobacter saltans DSM 12145]